MQPVEIQDLYSYTFYGGLKTKGKSIVFVKGQADEEKNAYKYDLMLCKEQKIRQLTDRGSVNSFAFEDESTLWFAMPEKEGKATSFWRLLLDGGEALKMGEIDKPGVSVVGLSEAGQLILSVFEPKHPKTDLAHAEDYEELNETYWYFNGSGFTAGKRSQFYLYDPKTKTLGECLSEGLIVKDAVLHNDRLHFAAAIDGSPVLPAKSDNLYAVDLKSLERRLLCETHLDVYTLDASDEGLFLFGTDYEPIGLNSNPNLYEYKFADHSFGKLLSWKESLGNTVGTDCALLGGNDTCMEQGHLCFTSTIVSHTNLFCVDGSTLHQLLEWPGTIHSFGYCEGVLYFIGAKPSELQELYKFESGKVEKVSDFQVQMEGKYVAIAKPVFYEGSLGNQQMGWVLYPKDFDPKKKYPAILDIHGGPKTVYGTIFYHEMQVWASHGYFVFFCNPFGSDGQGNEYADMRGRYGTRDYQDLMTFTDTVLAAIPQIDEQRIGVTGGSYGGFMTNWIIGHTDRFAAAASQRSISNWLSFYGTSDIGPEFTKDQQGCGLENIDQLWEHSPLKYAGNVTTPALFIHSDEDYRCPLEQGLQMYNGIISQDKPARLVMFRKENHELSRSGKPSHRLRRLNEITDWMDKWTNETDKQA